MKFNEATGEERVKFVFEHPLIPHDKVIRLLTTEEYRICVIENFDAVHLVVERHDKKEVTNQEDVETIKQYIMKGNALQLPSHTTERAVKGPNNVLDIVLMKKAAGHDGPSKTPYKDIFPLDIKK